MSIVVDSNVVGALLLDEAFSAQARRVLDPAPEETFAPDTLTAEMLSILWKKWHQGVLTPRGAAERLALYRRMPVTLISTEDLSESALGISIELDHPPYDCLYLALAIAEKAPLVTGDRELHAKAVAAGYNSCVRWIGDL